MGKEQTSKIGQFAPSLSILKGCGYDIVLFVSLFGIFFFSVIYFRQSATSFIFKIFSALADASLFTLLCSLFKGRAKVLTCIVPLIILILIMANVIYFRYFSDLLPASLYKLDGLNDPTIISNARNGFRWYDAIPLLLALCPAGYLLSSLKKKRQAWSVPSTSSRMRLIILLTCIASWGITIAGSLRRQMLYHQCKTIRSTWEYVFPEQSVDWLFFYNNHNFTGYIVRVLANLGDGKKKLTDDDRRFICSQIRYNGPKINVSKDSVPSNLIFIVVESLPYRIIDQNDSLMAPNLYALTRSSGAITKRCEVLAKYGRSSDAQFIYNTGLLPLRNEPLVTRFAYNDYPSLAKALNINSVEVIGENPSLWSHSLTTKSYGFSSLVSGVAVNKTNQDSIIFRRALQVIRDSDGPLFLFISSISMHNPYTGRNVTDMAPEVDYTSDPRDMEYYARLHHFDRSLGTFLSALKAMGRYDDSLIVIAGDHTISETDVSTTLKDTAVPFILINSPSASPGENKCTQLDVFPTLLDAMGVDYRYMGVDYRGLGKSILEKCAHGGKISEEAYKASELIIKRSK